MVATLAELLTQGLNTTMAITGKGSRGNRVLGGIRDLELPDDMSLVYGGSLRMKLLDENARKGRSGMTLMPFEYKFPHQLNSSKGIVAIEENM